YEALTRLRRVRGLYPDDIPQAIDALGRCGARLPHRHDCREKNRKCTHVHEPPLVLIRPVRRTVTSLRPARGRTLHETRTGPVGSGPTCAAIRTFRCSIEQSG